jgi:hypothetical protein
MKAVKKTLSQKTILAKSKGLYEFSKTLDDIVNLNDHAGFKSIYQDLGTRYKKMITNFSTDKSIELNTVRKWFYIGIGRSNFWFGLNQNRFINTDHITSISKECGLTQKHNRKVMSSLRIYRNKIRQDLDIFGFDKNSITLYFNSTYQFKSGGFELVDLAEYFLFKSFIQVEPPLDYLNGLDFPNPNWD